MSFVKDTTTIAEPLVEASAAPQVVETCFDHQEGQGASRAEVLDQDLRLDVIVEVPIPQLEFRPDVIEEKKQKKSSLGNVSFKFKIVSRKPSPAPPAPGDASFEGPAIVSSAVEEATVEVVEGSTTVSVVEAEAASVAEAATTTEVEAEAKVAIDPAAKEIEPVIEDINNRTRDLVL